MENFNHLMNIVMSFSPGLREYEGDCYITLEDDITDLVHYEEHIRCRNKAIMELLYLDPIIAFRYIKRFKDIMEEVERDFFKVRDYNSELTLEQFNLVCSLRGAAGTRFRNALQQIKVLATDLRKDVSEKKNIKKLKNFQNCFGKSCRWQGLFFVTLIEVGQIPVHQRLKAAFTCSL